MNVLFGLLKVLEISWTWRTSFTNCYYFLSSSIILARGKWHNL